MVKIALLYPCNPNYERLKLSRNMFDFYKVKNDISNYVKFVDVKDLENLFETINKYLSPSPTDIMNVYDFHYDSNHVLQGIYLNTDDSNDDEFNMLGSQLVLGNLVKKPLVIIKRNINDSKLNYTDINIDDIITSVIYTFLHKGVVLRSNGTIDEFTYLFDPLEIKDPKYVNDNIRYHEHKIFEYIMTFYVDINSKRDSINKKASRIFGKKIYGDVILSLRDALNNSISSNHDLTTEIFDMIYKLSSVDFDTTDKDKYKRDLDISNKDLNESKELYLFPTVAMYPNFYYCLNTEYNRLKHKDDKDFDPENLKDVLNDIV